MSDTLSGGNGSLPIKATNMVQLFTIVVLLAGHLWSQTTVEQGRLEDLNFVRTQLPRLHANFFFQLNSQEFATAANRLQGRAGLLTDAQFHVELARLVAMAGDSHTSIALEGTAAANLGFKVFPVVFRWLDDGVFVTGTAPKYSRALGTRLIRVGDTPLDQVLQLLGTVIPHENQQWLRFRAARYLRGQQVLQGLGLLPRDSSSPFTFQDLGGNEFTLLLDSEGQAVASAPEPAEGPLPLYLRNPGRNYWFTYSAALRLLYFRYRACVNDPSDPFSAFAASLLRTLDANPVDSLVLDFRDNTGGDSSVINPLLDGLGQRLSRLLSNPQFRTFTVINKGTTSSGLLNAESLKSEALQVAAQFPGQGIESRLVVTGEPTGGKPEHYGSVSGFVLPSSRLTGQYSTRLFSPLPGIPSRDSFEPDIPVGIRSTDYFARTDPVLTAIIARWAGPVPAPSGNAIVVNGASFRTETGLAPGSFAAAFGNFGRPPDQILVAGEPGQIVNAGTAQVNFIMPAAVTPGSAAVSLRSAGTELAGGTATITRASPGLFILQPADPSQPGAVLNEDYSVNSRTNPAQAGSILQIFATGLHPLDASGSTVQVLVSSVTADLLYSGPVAQFPGLWQVNARLPVSLSGQIDLVLIERNVFSNAITIWAR